jgi:hypothetical protein
VSLADITYIACQNCLKVIEKLVKEKLEGSPSISSDDNDILMKTTGFTEILKLKSILFGNRKTFSEEWV